MKKQLFKILILILIFGVSGYCDNNTEFVVEDDLTVNGTQGTYEDPDVELKGFVVIGATQPTYTANIPNGPGNLIVNGVLGVSSGAYIVGNTTITYITSSTFSGANAIFINDGITGNSLRKSSAGYLEWYDPTQYGDNLGNHLATTTLDMKNFPIINISSLAITGTGVSRSNSLLSIAGSTMVVLNNGNVGIGTTNPSSKLHIEGGEFWLFNNGNNPRIIIGDNGTTGQYGYLGWDSNNDYYRIETDGINGFKIKGNYVSIGNIYPSQPLIVGLGTTELFRIDSNGNVGIGTRGPGYKLDVNGDSRISGQAIIAGTATVQGNGFSVGGSTFVVIAGKVGIGTANPSGKFHIVGSGDGTTFFGLTDSSISNGIVMSDNGTIITMGSGFVGISTNSPQARLDVKAAGSTASDMVQIWRDSNGVIVGSMSATGVMMASKFIGDGTQLTGIATLSNVNPYRIIKADSSKKLVNAGIIQGDNLGDGITVDASSLTVVNTALFKSSVTIQGDGTTGLIVSGGNVGIGTTNPGAKLEVAGDAKIAENFVVTVTTGSTLSTSDYGNTIVANNGSTYVTFTLPLLSSSDVGARLTFVKLGTGGMRIQAPSGNYIADSTSGGSLYTNENAVGCTVSLMAASSTNWVILGGDCVWQTN